MNEEKITNQDIINMAKDLTIPVMLSNIRIQQIVTLLYLNKKIVTSTGVFNHQIESLQKLKSRMNLHIDYYSKNTLIQANFNFLNKIIDKWYNNSI